MTEPLVHGDADEGWGAVADAFARNFTEHGDVGAACCVYLDGKPVVDLWGGLADQATGRPWQEDTLVITFSTTKGVTAIVCNRLIEQGRLDPDAPGRASTGPSSRPNGKGAITVAGRALPPRRARTLRGRPSPSTRSWPSSRWCEALAAQAPNWQPGTAHGYHARTFGWLTGEIVRRVTGRLARLVPRRPSSTSPLGLDFHIGLPEELEPRVARLYPPREAAALQELIDAAMSDPDTLMGRVMSGPSGLFRYDDMWNTRALHATEMPSSNGIGDARSLARLYAACLGEVDGFRALGDDAVDRAATLRSEGTDVVLGMPTAFGLGFAGTVMLPEVGRRSIGHPGAGGSLGFADRDAGLGFGYVMNQMQLGMTGDARSATLVSAAYRSLG